MPNSKHEHNALFFKDTLKKTSPYHSIRYFLKKKANAHLKKNTNIIL